jgi:hypothetical protein
MSKNRQKLTMCSNKNPKNRPVPSPFRVNPSMITEKKTILPKRQNKCKNTNTVAPTQGTTPRAFEKQRERSALSTGKGVLQLNSLFQLWSGQVHSEAKHHRNAHDQTNTVSEPWTGSASP